MKILLGLLLLVMACAGFLYWRAFVIPRQKIEALESRLRSEGRRMDLLDFQPTPVPAEQNAASLYLEAYSILESLELEGESFPDFLREINFYKDQPELDLQYSEFMQTDDFQEGMILLEKAAALPFCQFHLDYSQGMEMFVPHVSPLMTLGKTLALSARRQLEAGDQTGCLQTLTRLKELTQLLNAEPFLISQLVKQALRKHFKETSAYVLSNGQGDREGIILHLDTLWQEIANEPVNHDWLEVERVGMLDAWRKGKYYEYAWGYDFWSSSPDIDEIFYYFGHRITRNLDERMFLERSIASESLLELPYHEVNWNEIRRELEDLPTFFLLSGNELDSILRAHKKMVEKEVFVRQADVVLDLYRIREETGAFPEDLSGFEQEDIQDPFTGRSLHYRKTEEGFLLYSEGPDQTDNGGVRSPRGRHDDILWSHPYTLPENP